MRKVSTLIGLTLFALATTARAEEAAPPASAEPPAAPGGATTGATAPAAATPAETPEIASQARWPETSIGARVGRGIHETTHDQMVCGVSMKNTTP